jgi:hypothetical protein
VGAGGWEAGCAGVKLGWPGWKLGRTDGSTLVASTDGSALVASSDGSTLVASGTSRCCDSGCSGQPESPDPC